MHTPYPEPLCELAGARRVLETAHKLIGNSWGDEGTTRLQHAWTADPDLIRRMTTGQACYISHGSATFVQVARPQAVPAHPAARTRPRPARAACGPAARPSPGGTRTVAALSLLPVSMTTSDPEPPHDRPFNPFEALGLPDPPRPRRRAGPRRLAGHRQGHPPRPRRTAATPPGTPRPAPPTPSSTPRGDAARRTPTCSTPRTAPPSRCRSSPTDPAPARSHLPAAAAAPLPDRARTAGAAADPRRRHRAGLSLLVLRLIPGSAAAPADVAGLGWFFVLTARSDLAPAAPPLTAKTQVGAGCRAV